MYTLIFLLYSFMFSDEGPGLCPIGRSASMYSDDGVGIDPHG